MNLNASIIDHRVTGLIESRPEWFADSADPNRRRSTAFVLLCMSTYLGISLDESVDLITEGGNDAGVDGLHVSDGIPGHAVSGQVQDKGPERHRRHSWPRRSGAAICWKS